MEPRAVLLLLVIFPSAAEAVKQNLTGTVGGSISLPQPVMQLGFILYGQINIAMVTGGKLMILEKMYENRLQWNNVTGLFTITDLQRSDSGIYSIDAKEAGVFTSYELSVFDSVSAPAVSFSASSDSCTLLCAVTNAEHTTLKWYRDEEVAKQNSSVLSLSLTLHSHDYDSSYRCVAANPAGEESVSVDANSACGPEQKERSQTDDGERNRVIGIVIPVVSAVVVGLVAFVMRKRLLKDTTRATRGPADTETDVQYSDVRFNKNRRGQERENVPEPSGDHGRTQLTTVYDKLEVHRLVSTDAMTETPTDISHSHGP